MGPTVDGFAVVAKEPLTPLHAGCRPLHTGGGSRHGAPAPRFSQLPPQPRGPPSSYANMGRPCWAQASPPAPGSVPPGKLQAVNRGWLCLEKAPLPLRERRTGLREPEMPAHTWHAWPRCRVLWGGSCPCILMPEGVGPGSRGPVGALPTEKDEHTGAWRSDSSAPTEPRTPSSRESSPRSCQKHCGKTANQHP